MDKHSHGRRTFLQKMIALGAAGVPIAAAVRPGRVHSADATGGSVMKTAYDPAATFELTVSEVELRRAPGGRMLMARIYQPQGAGPFPTLLDLHAAFAGRLGAAGELHSRQIEEIGRDGFSGARRERDEPERRDEHARPSAEIRTCGCHEQLPEVAQASCDSLLV